MLYSKYTFVGANSKKNLKYAIILLQVGGSIVDKISFSAITF